MTGALSPLGDSAARDYSRKLRTFEEFAAPELAATVEDLSIEPDASVLDLGCGTGLITRLLADRSAFVVGVDLSEAHVRVAAAHAGRARVLAGDGGVLPFAAGSFDLVWACNAVNHLADPIAVLRGVGRVLRPRGRLVIAQSGLLPEMFFAWDYHLDARVRAACHAFYRDRHGLGETDTAASMRLLGLVREAGYVEARARTRIIERFAPLDPDDRAFFARYFGDYWGPKLRPFLTSSDWRALEPLCDPASPAFCADRPDFHHIQTLTVVEARSG